MSLEKDLYKTKYWDYRLLNPDDCTICFILHYAKIVPLYIERLHDHVEVKSGSIPGRYVPVIKNFNVHNPHKWNNWKIAEKMRIWCDQRGIKYDVFWNLACEEHEKMGWRMTFMNSFSGQKMLDRIADRVNHIEEIFVSNQPFFMSSEFKGCRLQVEYYASLLVKVLKKYGNNAKRVIQSMIDDGIISEKFIRGDKCQNL